MDKSVKLEAIKEMAKGDVEEVEAHVAKCPKCGHEWVMGEEDYKEEETKDEE